MACRTFGWVQDPAKMENLRKTVEIFDKNSTTYREAIDNHIPHARPRTRWARSVSIRT